jgi:hypothetical protein
MKIILDLLDSFYYSEEFCSFDLDLPEFFYEYSVISGTNYFHCRILERNDKRIFS